MVIREPNSGRIQPLPDVQGKGKEKVSDEQVALDLLTLQTPKKKSPAEQYIFQRRTPTTTEPSGHAESPSLYAELGLTDSETESDEEVSPEINAGTQDEGQAGPNPGIQDEGQAGSNPGDAAESQPQSSHVVHAGPNLEHMDFEVTNASTQQNPEQIDEEFTTTAYPSVQENLKLPTKDQGKTPLKTYKLSLEPVFSQKLTRELSFTNQFLGTSSVPLMTTLVIDLTMSQPVSTTVQAPLPTSTTTAMQALLQARFRDLPTVDMKEILQQRMFEDDSYKANNEEARKKDERSGRRDARHDHHLGLSPPSQPPTSTTIQQAYLVLTRYFMTSGSSYVCCPPRNPPLPSSDEHVQVSDDQELPGDDHTTNKLLASRKELDVENNWASALASSYEPPAENSLLAKTDLLSRYHSPLVSDGGVSQDAHRSG
ncbi:hypothetical protein Tco_0938432 [Tanacetum coccineum]|uniref:Uncharacterized protein n=1 Tax=Tanacetum coccineum TaxID=301880 RepID=A0ABQ5DJQ1_9ASTR